MDYRWLRLRIHEPGVRSQESVTATLDDYRWMVSDAAAPWQSVAREVSQLETVSVGLISRLRKDLSAERAHLVVEQVELRRRAQVKFSAAERMFFTRRGLEQATDERIAGCKATRFPAGERVADLCCGIGGDLVALADRGQACGFDRDPVMALFAAANLRALGIDGDRAGAVSEDALHASITGGAWHCDPDRRTAGRRSTRGELFEPALDALSGLLEQSNRAALKLAPATEVPLAWNEEAELEWFGSRGECRQQVAWFGSLARNPGRRSATIVDALGGMRTIVGVADDAPVAGKLGRYLYEPHSAVLAAKLTAELCREHSLASMAAGIAYWTGDRLVSDGALDSFEIRDVLPFDRKQLRAYCREHGLSRLEIKKRGVDLDPTGLRKEIAGSGDSEATIIVAPTGGHVRAIVARRIRQIEKT
jgi:SAM-dependent methyltransferase